MCAVACLSNIVQMALSPITPSKSCTAKNSTTERYKKRKRMRDVDQVWSTINVNFGYKLSLNPRKHKHRRDTGLHKFVLAVTRGKEKLAKFFIRRNSIKSTIVTTTHLK